MSNKIPVVWTSLYQALRDHYQLSAYNGIEEEEIRIPDTIVFHGNEPVQWYYTPPFGFGIYSHSDISPATIFRAFTHGVSGTLQSEIIATITYFDGDDCNSTPCIGYLDEADLKGLLSQVIKSPSPTLTQHQNMIPNHINVVLIGECRSPK